MKRTRKVSKRDGVKNVTPVQGPFAQVAGDKLVELGGDPSVPSLACVAALPDWSLIRDILGGARTIRLAGEKYLPKFPNESDKDYDFRVRFAPFVNHFKDSVGTVASKPFSKEVSLQGNVTEEMKEVAEDIDGHGTSLHKFARDVYEESVGFGVTGILVDFPQLTQGMTLEDERRLAPRPYWVWYRPEDIIAMFTEFRAGRRYVTHVRLREDAVRRMGFTERQVKRVRVLDDDGQGTITWALWEMAGTGWNLLGQGPITLDEIPFRLVKFGRREWWTNHTIPPMVDLAHLQIEHYQQSSNLKHVLNLTGFPMLTGDGVQAPVDKDGNPQSIKVGPHVVLFAPPMPGMTTFPQWRFIEPTAQSIKALQDQIEKIETQMAKIGMLPLIRNKGGITATTEATNSAKAHASAEAWASDEKDMLEQCFVFTAKWLRQNPKTAPEVYIHTDFGVELRENAENTELMSGAKIGAISRRTLWNEWQRRGFLGPQFDPEEEEKQLAKERKDGVDLNPDLTAKIVGRNASGNTWDARPSKDSGAAGDVESQRKDRALASA
jgi:hypothetical protein